MSPIIRQIVAKLPTPVLSPLRRIKHAVAPGRHGGTTYTLHGIYPEWADAVRASQGYEDPALISRVVHRNRREAERISSGDQELSDRELQLLSALLVAFGRLQRAPARILDIGGEMGGYYRSLRRFLGQPVDWTVLETAAMASEAKKLFPGEDLRFLSDEHYLASRPPVDVVLASGVMQCLESPEDFWSTAVATRAPYQILTQFPLIDQPKDVLTRRLVCDPAYQESYPLWMFSRSRWMKLLQVEHRIVLQWRMDKHDQLPGGGNVEYRGYLLETVSSAPPMLSNLRK